MRMSVIISGWSVLIQSCSLVQGRENVKLVEWLLEAGANVNHAMGSGWTALHAAAYNGHIETVKVLLKRGADTLATASKKDRPPGRNLKPVDVTDVVMIKELLNNAASLT
jgi:ankyrin repeat protein